MPLRKGLIKYDGAIYKKRRICTVTQKKNVVWHQGQRLERHRDQPRNGKKRQKLGRAMKDSPESRKTWSCQHLIYFEQLAYKTIKKKNSVVLRHLSCDTLLYHPQEINTIPL